MTRLEQKHNVHLVKCVEPYFSDLKSGVKTFEVRKDDRDYKVGDLFSPYLFPILSIAPSLLNFVITYILRDSNYCKEGYVILGIRPINKETIMEELRGSGK